MSEYGDFTPVSVGCATSQVPKLMTRPERIELLAKALCMAKHGNEDMWPNYKAMAERLLSDEYAEVLRKVMQ